MEYIGFTITILCGLLISCTNNKTDTTKSDTHHIAKPIDGIRRATTYVDSDSSLYIVWTNFEQAVVNRNFTAIERLSFDSLKCCDTILSLKKFISQHFNRVFDTTLVSKFKMLGNNDRINITMEAEHFPGFVLNEADYSGTTITVKQFQVVKELTPDGAWTMTFDFIKTKDGYKLFGCNSYGGPVCCR